MSDRELDARISALVRDVAVSSPPPPPYPLSIDAGPHAGTSVDYVSADPHRRARPIGRRVMVGALAAFILIAGVVAVLRSRTDDLAVTSTSMVEARHQVIDYQQSAEPACPAASRSGEFDSMTFETLRDPDTATWRQDVRYPDGSNRTTIVEGNPSLTNKVYAVPGLEGVRGAQYQCDGLGIMLAEPGQTDIFFLDLPPDVPTSPEPTVGDYFVDPDRFGVQIAGDHEDSTGRPAQLWQNTITGFYDDNEASPLTQTTSWYIDPTNQTVLEKRFLNESPAAGRYQWTANLVTNDQVTVDLSTFSTTGYDLIYDGTVDGPTAPPKGADPAALLYFIEDPAPAGMEAVGSYGPTSSTASSGSDEWTRVQRWARFAADGSTPTAVLDVQWGPGPDGADPFAAFARSESTTVHGKPARRVEHLDAVVWVEPEPPWV
jgi:hypothetical protein